MAIFVESKVAIFLKMYVGEKAWLLYALNQIATKAMKYIERLLFDLKYIKELPINILRLVPDLQERVLFHCISIF